MPDPKPHNYGMTRQTASLIALAGIVLSIVAVSVTMLAVGVDERTAPIITSLLAVLGAALTGTVAALKSTEAADTASKSHRLASLTASKVSAVEMQLTAHCGEMYPAMSCPLRLESKQ